MTMLTTNNAPQTMGSREIAKLLEVRHDSVRRTIERLIERGVIACPPMVDVQEAGGNNRTYVTQEYRVGKRDSYVIVAQMSPEFTARLVDRWQALEAKLADPTAMLNDPAAMRGILLSYTEKVLELQGEVEEMRPQVQALERIAISDGSMCITDAAKSLQLQPKALFTFLRSNGWIYSRPGSGENIAYQAKLQSGVLEHKVTVVTRSDGSEKTTTQVRVTPKGLIRLSRVLDPVIKAA